MKARHCNPVVLRLWIAWFAPVRAFDDVVAGLGQAVVWSTITNILYSQHKINT